MMPLGGGRAIITLRAADRDRGSRRGCQRSWEVTCHHSCPFALQAAERGPWQAVGMTYILRIFVCECGSRVSASNLRAVTVIALWISSPFFQCTLGFLLPHCAFCGLPIFVCGRAKGWDGDAGSVSALVSRMSANKEATSSSSSGQNEKDASRDVHAEKSVDKLNVREFRERFYIPNGVFVELMDGEVVMTEKSEDNVIFFTKEQFNAGLRFPLPSLFKEFLHFTQIPPAYIHPNMVRVLMGCSILSMLFNLDLSLLEVLFIYSIKKVKSDIFSFVASLPSLQLVINLPNSTKGAARGHVLVKGLWAGLTVHPDRQFAPTSRKDKRGKLVEWVEKASFDQLNRLLRLRRPRGVVKRFSPCRISARLLRSPSHARARKARLNVREEKRQEGTLRKAPGDKRPASLPPTSAPAKKKKKVLNKGKEIKLPTPPKEIVIPPPTFVKEITIRMPDPSVLPSVSSSSEHIACLNGSGPSVPAARRLALLAEEATSVNQPGSPHPDADVAGASCTETLPPMAPLKKETGAENQGLPSCEPSSLALVPVKGPPTRRSRPAHDLKSGISGRLQDILLETIEVSCSSAQEDHPEESETEMAEENPTARCWSRMRVHPKRSSRSPFSYAELGEMLKRIPPGSDVDVPSAKMFEAAEMV
ncbi:hypothetical protein CK203_048717 [Vitis vinifera]|uniref:Uncharacterized protein n=1 Tax=Vitis vinifera TaxID=29760 RepID=A0A438GDS4_VITVI|nr:hypothetical protein CK203_048717 [Vitis vinifera]